MKYNDPEHIRLYEISGHYPKIHDQIFSAILRAAIKDKPVMDLGACIGLLSARMIDRGITKQVYAFEPSKKNLELAVKKSDVKYFQMGVRKENINILYGFMAQHDISTIVARRVFPEVAATEGIETVKAFAKASYAAHVDRIILEGRKQTKKATAALKNADLEAECFAPFYRVIESYNDVRVLERVKELV